MPTLHRPKVRGLWLPEETFDYGPTMGIDAAKASTIPQAVVRPGSIGAEVWPSDSMGTIRAALVTAAGHASKTVWFNKGRYYLDNAGQGNGVFFYLYSGVSGLPNHNGLRIVMESAAGSADASCSARTDQNSVILDLGGKSSASCFYTPSYLTDQGAHNVTIRGGVIENDGGDSGQFRTWGSMVLMGASTYTGYSPRGAHTVEDLVVRNVYQGGISTSGVDGYPASVVRRSVAYHCGSSGFGGSGTNAEWRSIRVSLSPWRCVELAPTDPNYLDDLNNNRATTKWFLDNSTWDQVWCHDGYGFGVWNDWNHFNTTITNCVMENNRSAGIFWEHQFGNNRFYHNYFKDNGNYGGGGGAWFPYGCSNLLFTGPDSTLGGDNDPVYGYPIIDVAYNEFDNYGDGPPSYPWPNGAYPHLTPHPWAVLVASYGTGYTGHKGVKVHHNKVILRGSGLGMGGSDDTAGQALWTEPTNEWHDNEYYVESMDAANWHWGPHTGDSGRPYTWTEWVAVMSHDLGSTRTLL